MPFQSIDCEGGDIAVVHDLARNFAASKIAPIADSIDRSCKFPASTVSMMGELGLFGLNIPNEYGGSGKGLLHLVAAIEEISKVCASHGITLSTHTTLCAGTITRFGTEEQRARFLPTLAAGSALGAFCLTEPEAGTDAGSIRSTAVSDNGAYILNGRKIFITNGGVAETFIVFAMTRTGEGHRGISAFIAEKWRPGFSIGKNFEKLGIHASSTTEVLLRDCRIPAENLLGQEGGGFKIAMAALDEGRIGVAAQALGIARAALDASVKHAKNRVQFGRPISDNQGIQWMLSDMAVQVQSAALLTREAAILYDAGKPFGAAAAMAKLAASEAAMNVSAKAVQIHGGVGYTYDAQVERFLRDAKVTEIYEGTSEVQRMVIAADLLRRL